MRNNDLNLKTSCSRGRPLGSRLFLTALIAMLGFVAQAPGQGQTAPLTGAADFDKTLQSAAMQASGSDLAKGEQTPVDNVISPERYRIGPGDVLALHILPFPGVEQTITVSADNSVILPRIGLVSVAGKTLAQIRDTIVRIYAERNPNSVVGTSLRRARTVYCTVRGNVAFPGVKVYSAATRVSSIVALANQPPASAVSKPATVKPTDPAAETMTAAAALPSYVARNITVIHRDGAAETVDLERAKYANEPEADPTVREGDEIIVPSEPPAFTTISIGGAVRRPATLFFRSGDKLSMLLRAGHGLRDDADRTNVILTSPDGARQTVAVNERDELAGSDVALQSGSTVIVGFTPKTAAKSQGLVEITGEVANPGTYPVAVHQTRLKDLVDMAGGFTENAYLPLAYVVRREKRRPNVEIEKPGWEQLQYTDLTFEDTSRLIIHSALKRPVASVDFVKTFRDNSAADNITLADGDIIVVPENPRRVYVYGQVLQPGYVEFSPGKRLGWYVERAGGYAAGAVISLSRIIKGKNKVWMEDRDNVFVEAGDEVYVAPPTNKPAGYDLQLYAFIGTVLTTLAFLTSTLIGILK